MPRKTLVEVVTTKAYRCANCSTVHEKRESVFPCPICGEAICGSCSELVGLGYSVGEGLETEWTDTGSVHVHPSCLEDRGGMLEKALSGERIARSLAQGRRRKFKTTCFQKKGAADD